MSRSTASQIESATAQLLANGNGDAISEFFSADYVAQTSAIRNGGSN